MFDNAEESRERTEAAKQEQKRRDFVENVYAEIRLESNSQSTSAVVRYSEEEAEWAADLATHLADDGEYIVDNDTGQRKLRISWEQADQED
jgi:hypothetical protein